MPNVFPKTASLPIPLNPPTNVKHPSDQRNNMIIQSIQEPRENLLVDNSIERMSDHAKNIQE